MAGCDFIDELLFGMFADDLPLAPSPYDWRPPFSMLARRRRGFSCARDTPDNPPCGQTYCSACTKVFRDNLGPQVQQELASGKWAALSFIDPTIRLTSQQLATLNLDDLARLNRRLRDRVRVVFKDNGLSAPKIIAALDFSRETFKEDGVETGHWWSPHIHGVIEVSEGAKKIQDALNDSFRSNEKVGQPPPAEIKAVTNAAGWIGYMLKDPRDIYRRVHLAWTKRPRKRRETSPKRSSSNQPAHPPKSQTRKQPMSPQEAAPLMAVLSGIPVQNRLFLMGYQFQGGFMDGRLMPWPPSTAHQGATATTPGDVNSSSEQGHTDQMDEVEHHTHTPVPDPVFRIRLVENSARFDRLRARHGYTPRPKK